MENRRYPALVVATVAVSAMDVGLLREASGIIFGEAPHAIDGRVVLEHVLRCDSVSRGAHFDLIDRGKLVVDDLPCRDWRAAVHLLFLPIAGFVVRVAALGELRSLDGIRGGIRGGDEVGCAVEATAQTEKHVPTVDHDFPLGWRVASLVILVAGASNRLQAVAAVCMGYEM